MQDEEDEIGLSGPMEYNSAGSDDIEVRPDVQLLETFLKLIDGGRLRVPKFQRPFVWRPDQMLDLFDSIERGYPIGSLLVWETPQELVSLDHVGPLPIPPASRGKSVSYLLDGHQRLSTLYACLYRPRDAVQSSEQRDWMWGIYRVLGEGDGDARSNRYVHWKKASRPPANYLPMRSVLKTLDFLAYSRELGNSEEDARRFYLLIEEAEQVAQRIKSYKISLVTLIGGNLAQAVEVFSRVNSKGQAMSPDQMVSALTYRHSGAESLADRIATMLDRIAESGFGEINSTTAFRAVLAVAGERDVNDARWDVLARRVEGRVSSAIEATDAALQLAVDFLRDQIGVPLARLIPYNAQLMLMTVFFHHCPEPSDEQRAVLERWFWTTSWSGYFAGANTTQIKQALKDIQDYSSGHRSILAFQDEGGGMLDFVGQQPRPFPDRFDLKSARVRAYLLWELRAFPVRHSHDHQELRAEDLLRRSDTAAFRRICTKSGLFNGSSVANRIIFESRPGVSVRTALLNMDRDRDEDQLRELGISDWAFDFLQEGDDESFIHRREKELSRREHDFIRSFDGLQLGEPLSAEQIGPGETEIDTE